MAPVVSVIMPTYNSADFVGEAIQSVLSQTYTDYELIVVDDGSTDETVDVIRERGDRITLISQDHGGPAAARNRGIEASRGQYIAFLDSDDRWRPRKLELQVAHMEAVPDVAMTMTGHVVIVDREIRTTKRGSDKRTRLLEGDPVRNIFVHSGVCTPTVMVRKRVFVNLGMFDADLHMSEDDNMWMRIACHEKIDLLDEPLVEVRLRKGSLTGDILKLKAAFDTHVGYLTSRYPEIGERVQSLVPVRASAFEYAAGRHYLSAGDYALARQSLARSCKLQPGNIRYRMWRWLSLLPSAALDTLRAIKADSSTK